MNKNHLGDVLRHYGVKGMKWDDKVKDKLGIKKKPTYKPSTPSVVVKDRVQGPKPKPSLNVRKPSNIVSPLNKKVVPKAPPKPAPKKGTKKTTITTSSNRVTGPSDKQIKAAVDRVTKEHYNSLSPIEKIKFNMRKR